MLGESAGRGARHRSRASARRRFTSDERKANTPLPDDPQQWADDGPRDNQFLNIIGDIVVGGLAVLFTGVCISIYNHIAGWGGMIALSVLGAFVSGLAIAARNKRKSR